MATVAQESSAGVYVQVRCTPIKTNCIAVTLPAGHRHTRRSISPPQMRPTRPTRLPLSCFTTLTFSLARFFSAQAMGLTCRCTGMTGMRRKATEMLASSSLFALLPGSPPLTLDLHPFFYLPSAVRCSQLLDNCRCWPLAPGLFRPLGPPSGSATRAVEPIEIQVCTSDVASAVVSAMPRLPPASSSSLTSMRSILRCRTPAETRLTASLSLRA